MYKEHRAYVAREGILGLILGRSIKDYKHGTPLNSNFSKLKAAEFLTALELDIII